MLSPQAQKVLAEYLNLPFVGVAGVRCPYFNNARQRQRAQLRVLIGKGTPQEIVEEAQIISLQYQAGLFDTAGKFRIGDDIDNSKKIVEIRKFLIDHNLGVECSGFVTQVLRAHFKETKNIDIARRFYKVPKRFFLRFLIAQLRLIENISVRTYGDNRNTTVVPSVNLAQAGDVIVLLGIKIARGRNHILLVTDNLDGKIKYAHARAWSNEGQYGHGVATGEIELINPQGKLIEQNWIENNQFHHNNETWREAVSAEKLEIRRINV